MIHIEINSKQIVEIKKYWSKWFFRADKIKEFVNILENDIVFRKMLFPDDKKYNDWKIEYALNASVIKEEEWQQPVCDYFFEDLSNESHVVVKYKKQLVYDTQDFLLRNYENYRKSSTLSKIVNIMKVEVCPYCNRNFLDSYSSENGNRRKYYFKGDLDHHYSKNEIPALALSFYNLVPCCKVCNHEKQESEKRTFYPFYDDEDEHCFLVRLYDENDETDITYDMPIENVENKRFDSTVWQGISNNFKIKLAGNNTTKMSEHMKNSNEIFRLEKKYNLSKEYVKEMIRKKYIYPKVYKDELFRNFSDIFGSESELLETFYGFSNKEESRHNRPLSKLTQDVFKQMEGAEKKD